MNNFWSVLKWEIITKLKDKYFLFVSLIIPVLLVILLSASGKNQTSSNKPVVVGVISENQELVSTYIKTASNIIKPGSDIIFFRAKLQDDQIPENTLNDLKKNISNALVRISDSSGVLSYIFFVNEITDQKLIVNLETLSYLHSNFISNEINLATVHIPQTIVTQLSNVNKSVVENLLDKFLLVIMYIVLVVYSGNIVIRSFSEEKNSKLIEVLLTLTTPQKLISAKLLALIIIGFLQATLFSVIFRFASFVDITPPEISANFYETLILFTGYIFNLFLFTWIGIKLKSEYSANTILSLITISITIPVLLFSFIATNGNNVFVMLLRFFPVTSVQTTLLSTKTFTETEYFMILLPLVTFVILIWTVTNNSLKNILDDK